MARIGIFGGSFDPVHIGHLLLAEACYEQAKLDQVLFIPAASPPHKQQRQLADAKHRLAMLELAIAGTQHFAISALELDRGGVSYTVDTLQQLHDQMPADQLFLLMGGDSLADLPNWRSPERILALATPLIVQRHDSPIPSLETLSPLLAAERIQAFTDSLVAMPVIEFSSTDIRQRMATGGSVRFRVPTPVACTRGNTASTKRTNVVPPPSGRDYRWLPFNTYCSTTGDGTA